MEDSRIKISFLEPAHTRKRRALEHPRSLPSKLARKPLVGQARSLNQKQFGFSLVSKASATSTGAQRQEVQ